MTRGEKSPILQSMELMLYVNTLPADHMAPGILRLSTTITFA